MDARQIDHVSELLKSYQQVGGINHLDCANLPSKRVIASLCEDLLQLLFPGFFAEEAVSSAELPVITNELVQSIHQRLAEEMEHSLRLAAPDVLETKGRANELACKFFKAMPLVRRLLQTDVEAAYDGDPAAKGYDEIILAYPGLEAIAIQRLAHILYREGVPLIPRMMTEWVHSRTGIDIHPGAHIGSHFFIDHGTGVVIGETCVIGSHVKLYHGVTLGAQSFPKDDQGHIVKGTKRHPNVEDYVTVYPNAIILGGETTLGARSTIGANVFLMKSVPPDTLLVMADQVQRMHDKNSRKKPMTADDRPDIGL
jgi:serine O-acetyltransferase